MKKLILLAAMAATVVPGAASAQQREMQQDRREVRQDRQELRRDRTNLRQDRRTVRRSRVAYVSPYGNWNYRPLTVGYQLRPGFYGSRYYVNNYNMYNVRTPGRYQRWVRYGDDLLLVNVRTGRVLQVVRNRYW